MTPIQWFAFVGLPAALAVLAIAGVRVFERLHTAPKTGDLSSSTKQPPGKRPT